MASSGRVAAGKRRKKTGIHYTYVWFPRARRGQADLRRCRASRPRPWKEAVSAEAERALKS
jgi:hypothetical protein